MASRITISHLAIGYVTASSAFMRQASSTSSLTSSRERSPSAAEAVERWAKAWIEMRSRRYSKPKNGKMLRLADFNTTCVRIATFHPSYEDSSGPNRTTTILVRTRVCSDRTTFKTQRTDLYDSMKCKTQACDQSATYCKALRFPYLSYTDAT
jgi:hypothetical protein